MTFIGACTILKVELTYYERYVRQDHSRDRDERSARERIIASLQVVRSPSNRKMDTCICNVPKVYLRQ